MRVALCQIVSTPDPAANLQLVAEGLREAAAAGARLAVFPEATMACFGVPLASAQIVTVRKRSPDDEIM